MIHLNIRPYGCNICLKSYSQQSNLKKHILTHQKKNGKNKTAIPGNSNYVIYQCNICKTEISDITDFNKHIKVCNLNPMNNPHLLRGGGGGLMIGNGNTISSDQQQHQNNNGVNVMEPKKEVNIEIKTELDDGSNNTHPTPTPTGAPTLITLHTQHQLASNHHHQTQNHQVQQINHQPQGQTHHQILTPNGHIITNFLELTNTNNLHIENLHYGKH